VSDDGGYDVRDGAAVGEDGRAVNRQRRYFLIGATAVVGGIGVVGAAVPFIRSWSPSAKARALGAPIRVNIAKLGPGEMLGPIPAWRGRPIYIVYRTQSMLDELEPLNDRLADPHSRREEQQPAYAQNLWRSRRPEIGIYVGLCTHLGCAPNYHPEIRPEPFDPNWRGGFFCVCHGSRFDMAGRVYRGVPAPTNLVVPPYLFETDTQILVGEDEETV
jgi:ubiquinol-cytochrome c reductase iron-sulfur subunit